MFLSGEVCSTGDRENTQLDRWFNRSGIPASSTGMSEPDENTVAHSGVTLSVFGQKSAEAIVAVRQESSAKG